MTKPARVVFAEVHIFTGTATLYVNLKELQKWTEDKLHMDPTKNPTIHNGFDIDTVKSIIEWQRRDVRKARKEAKQIPSLLFVIDDQADDTRVMGSGLVRELFMRGRHSHISTALSTQRMRSCDYMVRLQFTCLAQSRV